MGRGLDTPRPSGTASSGKSGRTLGGQLEGDWGGMKPSNSLAVRERLIATHVL